MSHNEDPHSEPANTDNHDNHNQSYICNLPPEILGVIFLWTCTFERDSWEKFGERTGRATILTSVSSHWCQLALQTQDIWNTVTFDVREKTSEAKAALLQHHLKHGIDLDISISMDLFSLKSKWMMNMVSWNIADVLFAPENVQKITSLRIRDPPEEWLTKLSQLPHIHTLVLEGLRDEISVPFTLDLRNQLLLRIHLSMYSMYNPQLVYGPLNLPLSVKELSTSGLRHKITLRILHRCPGLTAVCTLDPNEASLPGNVSTTLPTLNYLETLTWPAGELLNPIQQSSFPALKHLCLVHHYDGFLCQLPSRPTIAFCHRVSNMLESLELRGYLDWEVRDFKQLFLHNMPHLKVLKLVEWPMHSLVMAVQVLTPSKEEFRRHEVKALPHLQSLTLQADFAYNSTGNPDQSGPTLNQVYNAVNIAEVSLKMLQRRKAGQVDLFYLDLPALMYNWIDKKYVWTVNLQGRFRQVVRGQRLEIQQESEVLEWLY